MDLEDSIFKLIFTKAANIRIAKIRTGRDSKTSFEAEKVVHFAGKLFWDTTGLKSLCHTGTQLHKTINPNKACLFYTVVLRHHQRNISGPRAGYVLNKNDLFYKITEVGSALIPCGQISFKNLMLQK